MKTYRRADGSDIDGCTWVDGLEGFETDVVATLLIEEVWQLVSTRTFVVNADEDVRPDLPAHLLGWQYAKHPD